MHTSEVGCLWLPEHVAVWDSGGPPRKPEVEGGRVACRLALCLTISSVWASVDAFVIGLKLGSRAACVQLIIVTDPLVKGPTPHGVNTRECFS